MPGHDANHSRLATLQPPIDWDDAVGEMLLSMPDVASTRTRRSRQTRISSSI